jgi:sugar lactone lactonase YvrE
LLLAGVALAPPSSKAPQPPNPPEKLIEVERIPWPAEARSLEMFSALTEGPDGRIYAGTCNMMEKERLGAMLITLDPKSRKQEILAEMEKLTGEESAGTFPQSKIHSQICFDHRGVAWFGTHSYEWNSLEQYQKTPDAYSGGHLITYDINTREARDLGILVPHESIMSLALAERVNKVYCVMHPTGRFVVYDIPARKVTEKGAILDYPSRTILALKDGRGFTFTAKGDVVRYTPATDRLEKLKVAVPLHGDETDRFNNNPFALATSADEKSIYGTGWSSGLLFEYRPDDGPDGSIRSLGVAFGDEVVPGKRKELCIAMARGADGRIYYAGYGDNPGRIGCYDPEAGKRSYVGRMTHLGQPLGLDTSSGTAGSMCALSDGRLVVCDFNQKQTYYNLFRPPAK